eukprot:Hpha_TRINITY_DN16488_c1_g14::TRINITY_DN16488_c1_g14_i1::g.163229::m.163229
MMEIRAEASGAGEELELSPTTLEDLASGFGALCLALLCALICTCRHVHMLKQEKEEKHQEEKDALVMSSHTQEIQEEDEDEALYGTVGRQLSCTYGSTSQRLARSMVLRSAEQGEATDDILVFLATVESIVYEYEEKVIIEAKRTGRLDSIVTVRWKTVNVSVGEKSYIQQDGELTFKRGQSRLEFIVRIVDDPAWNMEAMFDVVLMRPKVVGGDQRQPVYLGGTSKTRVVVLNDEHFPHGMAPEKANDQWALVTAFLQHNYYLWGAETRWGLFWKTVPNFCFLFGMLINMSLVNEVASWAGKGAQYEALCWYITAMMLNFLLDNLAETKFDNLDLGGGCLTQLRMAMVQTMLQLTEEEQEAFPTGKLLKAVDDQALAAVQKSWCAMFNLYQSAVRLLVSVTFTMYVIVSKAGMPIPASIILTVMVIFDSFLLYHTIGTQSAHGRHVIKADERWSEYLLEHLRLRRMVGNLKQGMACTQRFRKLHHHASEERSEAEEYTSNVMFFTRMMPEIVLCLIVFFGGTKVMSVHNPMSIGAFTALVGTARTFGATLSTLFKSIFEIGNGYAAIHSMSAVLNARTRRKEAHAWNKRSEGVHGWKQGLVEPGQCEHGVPLDRGIIVHEVALSFPGPGDTTYNKVFDFEAEAGSLICVRGGNQSGKTTLLKLLAKIVYPVEPTGWVYYPPSWVVRYLDSSVSIMDGTLRRNLRFGQSYLHRPHEIWSLCQALGMSERCLYHTTPPDPSDEARPEDVEDDLLGFSERDRVPVWGDMYVGQGGDKLATSDRILTMLARALLSGCDMLLLAGTLDLLGEEGAVRVLGVLDEWVQNRAVPHLESASKGIPMRLRKPKTLFVTTKLSVVAEACNHTITVLNKGDGENCLTEGDVLKTPHFTGSPRNFKGSPTISPSSKKFQGTPMNTPRAPKVLLGKSAAEVNTGGMPPGTERVLEVLGEENRRLAKRNQELAGVETRNQELEEENRKLRMKIAAAEEAAGRANALAGRSPRGIASPGAGPPSTTSHLRLNQGTPAQGPIAQSPAAPAALRSSRGTPGTRVSVRR